MPDNPDENVKGEEGVVFCVSLAAFTFQFEALAVTVSLPTMARDFGSASMSVSMVALAFLLAATATFLPAGRLGERFGLKRTFLAGCVVATLGTLGCSLSRNLIALIVCRSIQGCGTGALVALGYAMIPAWVRKQRIGWGYGYLSMAAGLGMLLGVPLGGVMAELASWRWTFLSVVPLLLILCAVAWRLLPSHHHQSEPTPLDAPGALLFAALLASALLGLSLGREHGWEGAAAGWCLAVFLLLAAAFMWRLQASRFPLFSPELLKRRPFAASLTVHFLVSAVLGGLNFLMPFYLQRGCQLTPLQASIVFLAFPFSCALIGPMAGKAADRIGSKPLVFISIVSWSICSLLFSILLSSAMLGIVVSFLVVMGICVGLFFSPNNKFMLDAAPEKHKSMAASLIPVALNMGSSFGISFFEIVFSVGSPPGAGSFRRIDALGHPVAADWIFRGFSHDFLAASGVLVLAAAVGLLGYRESGHHPGTTAKS